MMIHPLKFLVPLSVLGLAWGVSIWMMRTKPEPEKRVRPSSQTVVVGQVLERTSYRVVVKTRGTVRARTNSTLIPEVSGRITEISPSFRDGGFFEKGTPLVIIDTQDYETAAALARAEEAQALALLAEEEARAAQALENWKALGRSGSPSRLVLREPQLAEAKARALSARSQVLKAERDVERATIRAPYRGRVLEKRVDVGQFVTTGTVLAELYAVDYAEIRLPVTSKQAGFLNLPEEYRVEEAGTGDENAESENSEEADVMLVSDFGGKQSEWPAKIVRTEGRLDVQSRQLFAIAQVKDPYKKRLDGGPPLKVGFFVEAEIKGVTLENVYVIPRDAVRMDNEVLTVDDAGKLRRRKIEPIWDDAEVVVTRTEIPEKTICLTSLPFAAEGISVEVTFQNAEQEKSLPAPKNEFFDSKKT